MKLYLAHSFSKMVEVRDWQLAFQAKYPSIKLHNPFFDGIERELVQPFLKGEITTEQYLHTPEYQKYVQDDIQHIRDSDGVIAFIYPNVTQIGTMVEIDTGWLANKPLYVISESRFAREHWFIKYMGAKTFSSPKKFEEFIRPLRVAFVGQMGNGKTTAAQYLIDNYSFKRYSFAAKLKEICKDMWPDQFEEGAKPRHLLQYVGTDMFRKYDPEVWVDYLDRQIGQENPHRAVIDDCRFPNEALMLRERGFKIVKILRNTERDASGLSEKTAQHASELEVENIKYDIILDNSFSIEELYSQLDEMVAYGAEAP